MKRPIEKYGFVKEVVDKIKPIVEAIEQSNIVEAEHLIARLASRFATKSREVLYLPRQDMIIFYYWIFLHRTAFPNLNSKKK